MTAPAPELVEACERHLERTKGTLWGRAWDTSDSDSRQRAASWLAEQMAAVIDGSLE